MPKPSLMNCNIYPASFVAWCRTLDKEVVARAILEGCSTQMQFQTSNLADDSGEASTQRLDESVKGDKAK